MQDFGSDSVNSLGQLGNSFVNANVAGNQVAAQKQRSAIELMQAQQQQKQNQISNVASMMKLIQPAIQEAAKKGQTEVDKVMTSFRSNPVFQDALKPLGLDPNNMVVEVDEDKIPKNLYRTQVTPDLRTKLKSQGINLADDQTSIMVSQSPDGTIQYSPDKDNLSPLDKQAKLTDIEYKKAAIQNLIAEAKKNYSIAIGKGRGGSGGISGKDRAKIVADMANAMTPNDADASEYETNYKTANDLFAKYVEGQSDETDQFQQTNETYNGNPVVIYQGQKGVYKNGTFYPIPANTSNKKSGPGLIQKIESKILPNKFKPGGNKKKSYLINIKKK